MELNAEYCFTVVAHDCGDYVVATTSGDAAEGGLQQ